MRDRLIGAFAIRRFEKGELSLASDERNDLSEDGPLPGLTFADEHARFTITGELTTLLDEGRRCFVDPNAGPRATSHEERSCAIDRIADGNFTFDERASGRERDDAVW